MLKLQLTSYYGPSTTMAARPPDCMERNPFVIVSFDLIVIADHDDFLWPPSRCIRIISLVLMIQLVSTSERLSSELLLRPSESRRQISDCANHDSQQVLATRYNNDR
jgi:hypothetical protein